MKLLEVDRYCIDVRFIGRGIDTVELILLLPFKLAEKVTGLFKHEPWKVNCELLNLFEGSSVPPVVNLTHVLNKEVFINLQRVNELKKPGNVCLCFSLLVNTFNLLQHSAIESQ